MRGMLELVEDDQYYFDADAGDRPIRWVEKFCRHYEGRFAGQPFLLHPIQKEIIRAVYGWKCRDNGFRRFTDVWFEAAVGAGKSPILAALGLYGLGWDGEPGAQVFSVAATYSQARIVFDCAKRFIDQSPELSAHLEAFQYEIRHPRSKSVWRIISGTPKAGARPSLILADEIHEWKSREVFDSLQSRMGKRQQPLFICATNTGESRQSLCWQLHEKAEAALAGKGEKSLYPIIWAAPKDAPEDAPEAWKAANPLIGTTISEEKVRAEYQKSVGDAALESRFRRLYLSRWVQGGNKWLDLTLWDRCAAPIDPEAVKDAPIYVGADLSLGDDLCAVINARVTPAKMYVDAHFWLPKVTAEKYQLAGYPYDQWAAAGHITLVDEPTISPAVKAAIAAKVVELSKVQKVKAVCYDRYKADEFVAALEGAGITCVPVAQGYSVSPGCAELDRRLKEESIVISPNPVLRACAEEVEVKADDRGNFWPVKPNARGKYQGKRGVKIDGITALVTALTEARKHNFPAVKKQWKGGVWTL